MQGHEKYHLNESIIIDTLLNEIFMDPEANQGEKIEPRIMAVLKNKTTASINQNK